MRSKIAIAGHPIHPILVSLPVGLLVWTLVCEIVYFGSGREQMWHDLSFWSGIAAIISALAAALPGFGGYVTMAVRNKARLMATLNLVMVVLFFIAMLLMLNNGAVRGSRSVAVLVLHACGVGLVALAGWLGGELVYRHHLAVVPDTSEAEEAEHGQHDVRPRLHPRA